MSKNCALFWGGCCLSCRKAIRSAGLCGKLYRGRAGKRVYLTINALFRNQDFAGFPQYLLHIRQMGIDAVIVSDPGVLQCCLDAGLEVHLSTQASTSNERSAAFWHKQGVKRVVLAREVTLEEISEIAQKIPSSLELEVFVHGAMCISYSGRCLLSSVLTGRSGNKGECAQPCRWRYTIHEAGYPQEYFPILEDEGGTYLLNSKDLMMIEYLPELIQAGVSSFKIEGRMKSAYYVGCVVGAYRKAMDAYYADPQHYSLDPALVQEIYDSATRRFTTGFYFGNPKEAGYFPRACTATLWILRNSSGALKCRGPGKGRATQ